MKKLIRILLYIVILSLFVSPFLLESFLRFLFPSTEEVLYSRASILQMTGEHLLLVLISSLAALTIGLLGGIVTTRKWGREFLPFVRDLSSLMQTFPPVAVLALAVPLVGFGFKPALIALVLYSVLPILNNAVAGLDGVSADVLDAAEGMGMSSVQVLLRIELPIAFPVIFAGIRTSVIINVGTAALGSIVGAGSLGAPIVSGLVRNNNAFVFQGAFATAVLALMLDHLFAYAEKKWKK